MSSIGIIGGADGPTAIFVSGSPVIPMIVLLAAVALAAAGLHLLRHRDGK